MVKMNWKQILIRISNEEASRWDEYCLKFSIKRVDLVRNAVRQYIQSSSGSSTNSIDFEPVLIAIADMKNETKQILNKINLEKRTTMESNSDFNHELAKKKIVNAIVKMKQDSQKKITTLDRLSHELTNDDPSLSPYLFPIGGGISF